MEGLYELLKIRGDVKKKFPVVMRLLAYLMTIFLIVNNASSIDLQYDLDYRLVSAIIFLFLYQVSHLCKKYNYRVNRKRSAETKSRCTCRLPFSKRG